MAPTTANYEDADPRAPGMHFLRDALDCADDLTRTRAECARAGRETARRAASMDTVATVLRRIR